MILFALPLNLLFIINYVDMLQIVKQRDTKEKREDDYIPADISRKILNMAHEQQVVVGGVA